MYGSGSGTVRIWQQELYGSGNGTVRIWQWNWSYIEPMITVALAEWGSRLHFDAFATNEREPMSSRRTRKLWPFSALECLRCWAKYAVGRGDPFLRCHFKFQRYPFGQFIRISLKCFIYGHLCLVEQSDWFSWDNCILWSLLIYLRLQGLIQIEQYNPRSY